jgi:hypothetical protein
MIIRKVTDQEADESMQTLNAGVVIPAREFSKGFAENSASPSVESADKPSGQLNEAKLKLLRAVVEYPMRPSREYSGLAHIGPNTLVKIRPEMVKDGLICEHKLEMNPGPGRSRIALSASDAGKKLIVDSKKG